MTPAQRAIAKANEIAAKLEKSPETDKAIEPGVPSDIRSAAPDEESEALSVSEAPSGDFIEEYVFDEEADDYVKKLIPKTDAVRIFEPRDAEDSLMLGGAYSTGEAANFDYRWCNTNEKIFLMDRENHFRPVREALDTRFNVRDNAVVGTAVMHGDLVLCRRPKSYTEVRAKEQARRHAEMSGEKLSGLFNEFENHEGIQMFGGVQRGQVDRNGRIIDAELGSDSDMEDGQETLAANLSRSVGMRPASRPEPARKTFAINAPFQRDKVAERFGAVGS